MDAPATFGEWLQQRRQALRLSRPELAQRASCSVPALRKIELGERRPSPQLAALLAAAIGLPADEHAIFVRVARGELNLERLGLPGLAGAQELPTPAEHRALPVPLTPLVGRAAELAELVRLLADAHCRLLTLTGPGGIGKTRLALEVAAARAAAQSAHFVPLAPLTSPEFIPSAIADAVNFKFSGPAEPAAQLLRFLRDKTLLLVLDNFEHLLVEHGTGNAADGCALLAEIRQEAPGVKLLVTSREPLDLQGEWVFDLHGLPVPPAEHPGSTSNADSSAVALFVQSARRTQAGFEPSADEWPTIAHICRLVGGVPLAIELAAAWVRVLSCAEIAGELERTLTSGGNLDFLATSMRDVPERHRSMRAVIDHSWNLLSADEQRALRRLAVFRGGFTREAAERVAEAPLTLLSALVAKSLVQRVGKTRYDLHELVRQYAASRLAAEAHELQDAHERHSRYYLGWLEDRDTRLKSHRQKEAVAELTGEMDNIRAAWDRAIAGQNFALLYRASATLMYLLEVRNWFKEGEATFRKAADELRAGVSGAEPDADRQVAYFAMLALCGFFRLRLGRADEAYALLSQSAAFLRKRAVLPATIYSLWFLGIDCWILGRFSEADESIREGLALARQCGERWYEAWTGEFYGRLMLEQGDYDQARQYLGDALAIIRELGEPSVTAHALSYLGRTMELLGRYHEAETLLRESLQVAREIDYRFAAGLALDGLGRLAHVQGSHEQARAFFLESAALFREMGDTHRLARTLNHDGLNSLSLGDPAGAQSAFLTALSMAYAGHFIPTALHALGGLAASDIRQEASQEALEVVLYVLQHPASAQATRDLAAPLREELRSRLPRQDIEAAEQRCASLSLDELVRRALARA